MVNLLPAIVLGGPPQAGKSVLFYSLTTALRAHGIAHHAIRACPDGEGNWSQETAQELVQVIRVKGTWADEFVDQICLDLAHRLLPMLVDMGGRPVNQQMRILRNSTHAILLLREDEPASKSFWLHLADSCGLLPLARLTSELSGPSLLLATEPVITGTLTGLERGSQVSGVLFEALVERIETIFTSYSQEELERTYLSYAPVDLVISLTPLLQSLAPGAKRWDPKVLPVLLEYIPLSTPLAVYGHGPHWLYGALAAHAWPQPFYQFDPRFPRREASPGWLNPPSLQISTQSNPDVLTHIVVGKDCAILSVNIIKKHLDYLQSTQLLFPPLPANCGLILDGSMPSWLLTALVRLYIGQQSILEIPWVACHQPQLNGAVIIFSKTSDYPVGKIITLPPYF